MKNQKNTQKKTFYRLNLDSFLWGADVSQSFPFKHRWLKKVYEQLECREAHVPQIVVSRCPPVTYRVLKGVGVQGEGVTGEIWGFL